MGAVTQAGTLACCVRKLVWLRPITLACRNSATGARSKTSPDDATAPVNVRHGPRSVGLMSYTEWAETTAHQLLAVPLPRRWAHSRGVAATAQTLTSVLGANADMLIAAAWLHDIGYAPGLHDTGFHPLDGARYLRDVEHAAPMLCRLVAHHSCALIEATERGIAAELLCDFEPAPTDLADALIYSDITTGPGGERLTVQQRLTEIRSRYGRGHVVSRAAARAAPELTAAVSRVQRRLAMCRSAPRRCTTGPGPRGRCSPDVGTVQPFHIMLDAHPHRRVHLVGADFFGRYPADLG